MKSFLYVKRDRDDCGCEVLFGHSKKEARQIGRCRIDWQPSWNLTGSIIANNKQEYELQLQSLQPTSLSFRGLEGSLSCAGRVVARIYVPEDATYTYEIYAKGFGKNVEMKMIVDYPPQSLCVVRASCDGSEIFRSPQRMSGPGDQFFQVFCFKPYLWVECSSLVAEMLDETSIAGVLLFAGFQNSIVGHMLIGHNDIAS